MRMKVLQGAAAFGVAVAACIMSSTVTASAASLDGRAIKIDYQAGTITVDTSASGGTAVKDRQIYLSVASIKQDKIKPTTWDACDVANNKAVFDISSMNTQKDNFIQLKGDVTADPITIFIPASNKSLKLAFDGYTGNAYLKSGTLSTDAEKFEYRTQYSGWNGNFVVNSDTKQMIDTPLASSTPSTGDGENKEQKTNAQEAISLKLYQERGASLYFRTKAAVDGELVIGKTNATTANDGVTIVDNKYMDGTKDNTPKMNVWKVPSLPGKEIKVSVGRKAGGPKVSVDYLKAKITIPAGVLYRVSDANVGESTVALGTLNKVAPGSNETGWTKTATSAKVTLDSSSTEANANVYKALLGGGTLELKKAGKAETRKADSKVSVTVFNRQEELQLLKADGTAFDESKEATQLAARQKETVTSQAIALKSSVADGQSKKVPALGVKVTEVTAVQNSKKVTTSYKMTVTNDDAYAYEISVNTAAGQASPATNAKWTIISAKKTTTITKTITGISKDGASIFIRRYGDKKKGDWTTPYIKLGEAPGTSVSSSGSTGDSDKPAQKTDEQKLNTIAEALASEFDGTGEEGSKKELTVTFAATYDENDTGKSTEIDWGTAKSYTKGGETLEITAKITEISGTDAGNFVVTTDGKLGFSDAGKTAANSNYDNTVVDKSLTLTVSFENGGKTVSKSIHVKTAKASE